MLEIPKEEKQHSPVKEFIKDPYILEFLGLQANTSISESTLESAIIAHLQTFLMEMGKGFAFVARQQHIVTATGFINRSRPDQSTRPIPINTRNCKQEQHSHLTSHSICGVGIADGNHLKSSAQLRKP
jgi:hypothetical protein